MNVLLSYKSTVRPLLATSVRNTRFPTYQRRMVQSINTAQEFNDAIPKGLVIVDFFATWCGPCKMVAPIVEKLEPQYDGVKFLKVDIEKVPDVASKYEVSAVPSFFYLKDGKVVDVVRGAAPAQIKQGLDKLTSA